MRLCVSSEKRACKHIRGGAGLLSRRWQKVHLKTSARKVESPAGGLMYMQHTGNTSRLRDTQYVNSKCARDHVRKVAASLLSPLQVSD